MFTLTFEQLRSPEFHAALKSLGGIRALPHKVGYNVTKLLKAIRIEEKVVNDLFDKAIDPFLEKDANGKRVPVNPAMPNQVKVAEGQNEALNEELAKFYKNEAEIKRPRMNLEDVSHGLTPNEILVLEALWIPLEGP